MEERKGAIVDALLVRAAATTDAFLCGMKDEDIPKSLARQSGPILEKKVREGRGKGIGRKEEITGGEEGR